MKSQSKIRYRTFQLRPHRHLGAEPRAVSPAGRPHPRRRGEAHRGGERRWGTAKGPGVTVTWEASGTVSLLKSLRLRGGHPSGVSALQ